MSVSDQQEHHPDLDSKAPVNRFTMSAGASTAFKRFSLPLTVTGTSVNTAALVIVMFGYMIINHAWSLSIALTGIAVITVINIVMSLAMIQLGRRINARFYALLEREADTPLTADELKTIRATLLLIPWRSSIFASLAWVLLVPAIFCGAYSLIGEQLNWLNLEFMALAIVPFTFVATLLSIDQVLSPFVKYYFPAIGLEEYGSKLVITDAKKTLLFNSAFAVYPLVWFVILGANSIGSSSSVAEATQRFKELAIYAVGFIVLFVTGLALLAGRKTTAKQLVPGENREISQNENRSPEDSIEAQENLTGSILDGKYLLQGILGKGGMATVYRGNHQVMKRPVAVKILSSAYARDPEQVKRFRKEARATVSVQHPNIVEVHDCGVTAGGVLYLVMDLIEGSSLSQLSKSGELGIAELISVMRQVCQAIAHAHSNHVIHRDLKPGNIMIIKEASGALTAKVVDFGIAKVNSAESEAATKLTQTGQVFGSPAYMSPEQCQGKALDQRSDIYSLGCIFYELLTGNPPFAGDNFMWLVLQHVNNAPAAMNFKEAYVLPEESRMKLEVLVAKCLEKDPDNRYANLDLLLDDLNAIAMG